MRVVSILATLLLVVVLGACGGGGGPKDFGLTDSPPVTIAKTTTSGPTSSSTSSLVGLPESGAFVARARFSRLAVYGQPDAPRPLHEFVNPWLAGDRSTRVAQVFLVDTQRPDGWVRLLLPARPNGSAGWVRAFDVTITRVEYRIRVALRAQYITVFRRDRVIYQGPIDVGGPARSTPPGRYYLRRLLTAPRSHTTGEPHVYGLIKRLAGLLPLGTPVDIVA